MITEYSARLLLTISTLFLAILSPPVNATTYQVGPDKAYTNIGDVPWESLEGGDSVQIYWKSTPYREKWVLCRAGSESSRITITGIPNSDGELPIISGENASTRSELNFWNDSRGIIKIGGANNPPDTMPAYITIENLDIQSGRPAYNFTDRNSQSKNYSGNCAAVYIEKGEHIIIRNCNIHDCGNGIFAGHETLNLLVESCYIYNNGISNSIYMHNNYTETKSIVFQYNHFGPLRDGCLGNNLKDRSAGCIIRYNWIEGGNRQLDLVETDYEEIANLSSYSSTHVYGNILIEAEGEGNSQICHYGGDSGNTSLYRKGILYFYNNTIISTRSGNTTILRLSSNDEKCEMFNNILYTSADGRFLAISNRSGVVNLRNNWIKTGWKPSHGSLTGSVNVLENNHTGITPGFVDTANKDYHLQANSPCINAGIATGAPEYDFEGTPRLVSVGGDNMPDIGADEFTVPIGVYSEGLWLLDANGNGQWDDTIDKLFGFGDVGYLPITGDWNGDGNTNIGIYKDGLWLLDINGNGQWDDAIDKFFGFGNVGYLPVIGDWNGNGNSNIGVYKDGLWLLDMNGNGQWDDTIDRVYSFGSTSFVPVSLGR